MNTFAKLVIPLLAAICLVLGFSNYLLRIQIVEIEKIIYQLEEERFVSLNTVADELLKPKLLDDSAEIATYLENFPFDQYEKVRVGDPAMGAEMYLDDIDDFIKNTLRRGEVWEEKNVEGIISHTRLNSTAIDVGAHIGAHTLYMSRMVGPNGRVYAFEPQKKLFRELTYNMRLNKAYNVVPLRFAVGDTSAIIEMNPHYESNEGGIGVGSGGDRAELRTIDSFNFENVSLIKIDVEGLENAVLEGARRTIMKNRPVLLVEIQGGLFLESAPPEAQQKIRETIELIEGMGYSVPYYHGYNFIGLPASN